MKIQNRIIEKINIYNLKRQMAKSGNKNKTQKKFLEEKILWDWIK